MLLNGLNAFLTSKIGVISEKTLYTPLVSPPPLSLPSQHVMSQEPYCCLLDPPQVDPPPPPPPPPPPNIEVLYHVNKLYTVQLGFVVTLRKFSKTFVFRPIIDK